MICFKTPAKVQRKSQNAKLILQNIAKSFTLFEVFFLFSIIFHSENLQVHTFFVTLQ